MWKRGIIDNGYINIKQHTDKLLAKGLHKNVFHARRLSAILIGRFLEAEDRRNIEKEKREKGPITGGPGSNRKPAKVPGALKIIVFGSFARGDVDVNSDLDLFVLMPSTKTGKEWSGIIEDVIDRKVAMDLVVYNDKELYEMLPASRFMQEVVKGRVVYEKAA